jgi:hypothetical protein
MVQGTDPKQRDQADGIHGHRDTGANILGRDHERNAERH